MVLGVNGIRLVVARSGVARCIEAVLAWMGKLPHPFAEIRVYTPQPLPQDMALPSVAHNVVLRSSLPYGAWEQYTLPKRHGRKNILFCPSYVIPLSAKCPTVLAHHGSYEGYPQAFSWWQLNKARAIYCASARRATVFSTVSEFSKRDIVRFYGLAPERINVVPEGVDTSLFRPITDQQALSAMRLRLLGDDVPFIVYIGKPTERRNLSNLIRAFAALKRDKDIPHKLVLVGADLPGTSPFRDVIGEQKMRAHVVILGYASHADMPLIYNASDLFIYPSSYEGFGMPVLEAMACGTPVIALNNTAFPEFAGGVARLLPDARVETLKEGMYELLTNVAARENMRQEGPKRAAEYDWQFITQRYLKLMLTLVN